MSIPVALDALHDATTRYPFAYLLTVSDDQRSHAVAVRPLWSAEGDVMTVGEPGRRTTANARARGEVSLVWPPTSIDEYSLIVDGHAIVSEDGALVFTPTNAVLHRPAPGGSHGDAGSCGNDCVPLV